MSRDIKLNDGPPTWMQYLPMHLRETKQVSRSVGQPDKKHVVVDHT